jgi:hypothetical protein
MAWTILSSDQTKASDKVTAGAYITGEGLAHGMVVVYGGALICGYVSAACYKALTAGGGLLGALCHYGECADTAKAIGDKADEVFAPGSPSTSPSVIDPIQNIFDNPWQLNGKAPGDISDVTDWAQENGWRVETLGRGSHEGEGFVLREYTPDGQPTGRMIQWHPGGGHHGPDPYWKISSGPTGTQRIGPQFVVPRRDE